MGAVVTRTVLFAAGVLVCLTAQCGPAQAQTAREAISVLCPRRAAIAPAIEAAAERHHVDAVVLTAVALKESSCNPRRANVATGCYGLMGIKLDGSANPDHLSPAELTDPETSADLGARHLAKLLRLCGTLGGALGTYHSKRSCRTDGYARRVLGLVEWARAMVKWLRERRS